MATGVIAVGGLAVGVISYGGLALALAVAIGGLAIGAIAIGGGAIGYMSYGGGAYGGHALGANARDPKAMEFFLPWAQEAMKSFGIYNFLIMAFMFLVAFGVPIWVAKRQARSSGKVWVRNEKDRQPWRHAGWVVSGILALLFGWFMFDRMAKPEAPASMAMAPVAALPMAEVPVSRTSDEIDALSQTPHLRGLQWQDKIGTDGGVPGWTATGIRYSPTGSWPPAAGVKVAVPGEEKDWPRFLSLWFSHPDIDSLSDPQVSLCDQEGFPILTPVGHSASDSISPRQGEQAGWVTATVCAGTMSQTPPLR
jgi:hypothetical protein